MTPDERQVNLNRHSPAQPPPEKRDHARNQLSRCPLFQDMANGELDAVFHHMTFEDFPADDTILVEGRAHQSLWVLVTGRCEVVKCGNGDHQNQLAVLDAGSVFGEMSFFEAAPHSASVHALTDVTTMRLTREAYDRLRSEHPDAADKIACNVVRILAGRLRRMDEWTCELVQINGNEKQHKEWQEFRARLYSSLHF